MPPCRFCLSDADESICLECKSKYEALKRENQDLKNQISFLRRSMYLRNRESVVQTKLKIKRKD